MVIEGYAGNMIGYRCAIFSHGHFREHDLSLYSD